MKIFVKLPQEVSGKTIPVEVDASDHIEKLTELVQDKEESLQEAFFTNPLKQPSFTFNGRQLEGGKTFSHYNIPNESTIEMALGFAIPFEK